MFGLFCVVTFVCLFCLFVLKLFVFCLSSIALCSILLVGALGLLIFGALC